MGENYIQVPADDAGKRVRTWEVVKSATTVHAHFFIQDTAWDQAVLTYTGADLTEVVYLASATTMATVTLAYGGGLLTSVVKTFS
jgi:hypothetical protein